jgi:hypothetical protein
VPDGGGSTSTVTLGWREAYGESSCSRAASSAVQASRLTSPSPPNISVRWEARSTRTSDSLQGAHLQHPTTHRDFVSVPGGDFVEFRVYSSVSGVGGARALPPLRTVL